MESFIKAVHCFFLMFENFDLSLPVGIVVIVLSIVLIFFVFKFLKGFLRFLFSFCLFFLIIAVIYFLFKNASLIGKAITGMLQSFVFLRCNYGLEFFKEKKK